MGKKGSWLSAIRKVFTHNSKEKPSNVSKKKDSHEKKGANGISRNGEGKSFIIPPLFREPSSIEKILGEADQQLLIRPSNEPKPTSTFPWRPTSPSRNRYVVRRPEPTLRHRHLSATKIQSAYRGYQARRNFRSLRGLVRLQGMVRSQNAKRQTIHAMKQLQLLVRVQTQIQSRRIQMLENQTLHQQGHWKVEKEGESVFSKWTTNQRAPESEDWDDSLLTKEEIEARSRKKVEAAMKRERAMAYAYSHQLWNTANPKSPQTPPLENQTTNAYPWWYNSSERKVLPQTSQSATKTPMSTTTPPRPIPHSKPPGPHHNSKNKSLGQTKNFQATPIRTPSPSNIFKNPSKQRALNYSTRNEFSFPLRDDDSLTSCPPFSVPNYMAPTKSARAKVRANSNPKERLQGSMAPPPANDSKRRFSFSFAPNIVGSFKWGNNKGTSSKKESSTVFEKQYHRYQSSIGDLSVDSAVSMPAMGGRKPFNRFV